MAGSVNALSYLDPSAYQSVAPASGWTNTAAASGPAAGVSATDELKAIESQGDFKAFLSSSTAVALLQPANTTDSAATNSANLIANMLQQVLAAYQSQTQPAIQSSSSTAAGGVSAVG